MSALTRVYHVIYGRPGRPHGYMNWPGSEIHSNARIRAFTHHMFRRVFGRSPDGLCWHMDGFMAECRDRRGNFVEVEQHNHGDPRHSDGTWNPPPPASDQRAVLMLTWSDEARRVS